MSSIAPAVTLVGLTSEDPSLARAAALTLAREHGFAVVPVESIVEQRLYDSPFLEERPTLQDLVDKVGWDDALASRKHGATLLMLLESYRVGRSQQEWADALAQEIYSRGGPSASVPVVVPDADNETLTAMVHDLGGVVWAVGDCDCPDSDITLPASSDVTELQACVRRALQWSSLALVPCPKEQASEPRHMDSCKTPSVTGALRPIGEPGASTPRTREDLKEASK